MLVIHPKDRTTAMLSALYEGMDATVVDQSMSNREIDRAIHHCKKSDRIMLLGHGCDNGLFTRNDDTIREFDRIIVGHSHAYHLRKHGGNLIGIWCHADQFARKEGLHGLFSGMIISDIYEAEEYGIKTLQMHIDEANDVMFATLRRLLDEGHPLHEIPELLQSTDHINNHITRFNYPNFFYL